MEISDFNPTKEETSEPKKLPDFGSIEQYTDLILKYSEAVVREANTKLTEYPVGVDGVLTLLLRVSDNEDVEPWITWRSWMQRHLIPIMDMTETSYSHDIMEKRLRDLLGYVYMALELNEFSRMEGYDDAWSSFRNMAVDKEKR